MNSKLRGRLSEMGVSVAGMSAIELDLATAEKLTDEQKMQKLVSSLGSPKQIMEEWSVPFRVAHRLFEAFFVAPKASTLPQAFISAMAPICQQFNLTPEQLAQELYEYGEPLDVLELICEGPLTIDMIAEELGLRQEDELERLRLAIEDVRNLAA